ncbi:MAG: DUF3306 domain-containing protein [Pseudomonadota bacterium]
MNKADFWSRRRQAVAEEEKAEEVAIAANAAAQIEAELAEREDTDILQEFDLPEPEAIESSEQVRAFLNATLPQRLKNRALRRLWRLNPTLANLDGLIDYGEDYTDAATVIENMQTAYEVGKGMLAHVEELARQAEEKLAAETSDDAYTDDFAAIETASSVIAEEVAEPGTPVAQPVCPPDQQDEELMPARRRMMFTFETTAA